MKDGQPLNQTTKRDAWYAADHVDTAQRVWDAYYEEGKHARRHGCDADECPYLGGIRMTAWMKGWSGT